MAGEEHQILFYTSPDGVTRVEVSFHEENLWLTQKRLAELFGVTRPSITRHLSNIFASGELVEESVCSKIEHTAEDGKRYRSLFYNLDAVIAVGYRVNSYQATQFRMWATKVLRDFLIKGFVLDDDRLKQGRGWGQDYFDELLERIREIRASERRFYQKITDIYEQCSFDYDPKAPITQTFFATVQNKLHWAIHGHTASEVIRDRADSTKPNMGLMTWKNAPKGKILKSDVTVSQNYLAEDELRSLNRIVTMYLDFAERQAERRNRMSMADWVIKLDGFLQFNDYDVLQHVGKVSAEVAKLLEERGIKVLFLSLPDAVSGLTCIVQREGQPDVPVIVVNREHPLQRRRHTLAHELGHRLIQCDEDLVEKAVARLSGAFLMPAQHLLSEVGGHRHAVSYQEIMVLKKFYRVSAISLWIRLYRLGIIDESTYQNAYRSFARSWRSSEPEALEDPQKAMEQPARFQRLCYRALAEGLISIAKASELLQVPVVLVEQGWKGPGD